MCSRARGAAVWEETCAVDGLGQIGGVWLGRDCVREGKCFGESGPGASEASGEVAGVSEEGGPLRGGVDVEAAVAEELL